MAILITGGAGYIGSHMCIELLMNNEDIVVFDNLVNSNMEAIKRVEEITEKQITFYQGDLLNHDDIKLVFEQEKIEAVIHFAGLKAVGESVEMPLTYYHNNVTGTLNLCSVMRVFGVKRLVFSSSATVYGASSSVPICETAPLAATNPYGRSKLMIEDILRDLYRSDEEWSISLLRYFNPIGAHESGLIGENPNGIPNNLMPYITQVAMGKMPSLRIFGSDYSTADGTGVRDYIHVMDLVKGHVQALMKTSLETGVEAYNLGTGKGYSVMDLIATFEKVSGVEVPYKVVERRPGDIATSYADPSKAKRELQWTAKRTIEDMCRDAWNWQQKNPKGYQSEE